MISLFLLIIGAERVANPVGRQENPAQVGVPGEVDTNEVECFALVPVGGAPDVRHTRHLRQPGRRTQRGARYNDFQHQVVFVRNRRKIIDHLHRAGLWAVVDGRHAGQQIEKQPLVVAQEPAKLNQPLGRNGEVRLKIGRIGLVDFTKLLV